MLIIEAFSVEFRVVNSDSFCDRCCLIRGISESFGTLCFILIMMID